jgi:hypothetical protein
VVCFRYHNSHVGFADFGLRGSDVDSLEWESGSAAREGRGGGVRKAAKSRGKNLPLWRRVHRYLRRRWQKVMQHFSEIEKSFQKRPISQQNLLINICETYNLDLLSKSYFNRSI